MQLLYSGEGHPIHHIVVLSWAAGQFGQFVLGVVSLVVVYCCPRVKVTFKSFVIVTL